VTTVQAQGTGPAPLTSEAVRIVPEKGRRVRVFGTVPFQSRGGNHRFAADFWHTIVERVDLCAIGEAVGTLRVVHQ
jgi:hypothetical protein